MPEIEETPDMFGGFFILRAVLGMIRGYKNEEN